ncbi:MAG: hypothetical protein LBG26_03050 [Treponema sp.]|nr:hypothetical protein [Treponema sp.]
MKFLCNTEFIHSGARAYFSGTVYHDITEAEAGKLINLDRKKPLGALSFFTPVDEEAVSFVKTAGRNSEKTLTAAPPADGDGGKTGTSAPPKPPTRAELIAEAKNLGIRGADRMNAGELKEVILAMKQDAVSPLTGGTEEGTGGAPAA